MQTIVFVNKVNEFGLSDKALAYAKAIKPIVNKYYPKRNVREISLYVAAETLGEDSSKIGNYYPYLLDLLGKNVLPRIDDIKVDNSQDDELAKSTEDVLGLLSMAKTKFPLPINDLAQMIAMRKLGLESDSQDSSLGMLVSEIIDELGLVL